MTDLDVAIIGGGLSGLAVADHCARSGLSFRVFEARPRLGGRILSVDVPGGPAR
jgi:monoamine oxidase